MPRCPIVHEEDPRHLDHSLRVEVEEMLALANKEDEAMEDDVVVDGTAVVEEDSNLLLRPKLAHNVLTVASTDTMLRSVLEEPALQAAVELHSL